MSDGLVERWKLGNEFVPYHPSASHVEPAYRDGWNHCYKQAAARIEQLERHIKQLVYISDGGMEERRLHQEAEARLAKVISVGNAMRSASTVLAYDEANDEWDRAIADGDRKA